MPNCIIFVTCCLRFLGCLALSLCMEDIGGVSLAVVVGKVPGVQVNFHKKDKQLYHLNREMTYHCTHAADPRRGHK